MAEIVNQKSLKLYASPFACSMAAHISLIEFGIEHQIIWVERGAGSLSKGGNISDINPKRCVPVLEFINGGVLTENIAVLLYVDSLKSNFLHAPLTGEIARFRLCEWLSYVATELHKQILWPHFNSNESYPKDYRKYVLSLIGKQLDFLEHHLKGRSFLVTNDFTIADAHLGWALFLIHSQKIANFESWPAVGRYFACLSNRDSFKTAIAIEFQARQKFLNKEAWSCKTFCSWRQMMALSSMLVETRD